MKRFIAIIMTLCMIFGLSSVGVWAADATWQTEPAMTTPRYCALTVTDGEKIYVVGGKNNSGFLNSVEIFDTNTNTWSTGASIPSSFEWSTASLVGGKIYVIGGKDVSTTTFKDTVYIYDINTNTWTTGTPIQTARQRHASAVIGNKIYVMGGVSASGFLNTVEIYDTTTGIWTTGNPLPTVRCDFVSEAVGDKIYITAGYNNGGSYGGSDNSMKIYDTSTGNWTTGATIPTRRFFGASASANGNIYVLGGNKYSGGATNVVEIYSITNDTWESGVTMTASKSYPASVVVHGKLYAIGGISDTGIIYSMESLQVTPQISVPNAPSSLTATGGNSVVDLSWGAVSGATSYTLKRSTTAGGPYTVIAENLTGTTYSDTNVTNGTTYYYVVTAINTAGSSSNSNEASATPQAPASAGKALLVITMTNGLEKEYDLSMTEINAFINWYDSKASGSGSGYYTFNKTFNLGPFLTRVDYITFDKIQNFEVMQYQ